MTDSCGPLLGLQQSRQSSLGALGSILDRHSERMMAVLIDSSTAYLQESDEYSYPRTIDNTIDSDP